MKNIQLIKDSRKMQLMVLPSIFSGFELAFVVADFSKYVAGYIVKVENTGYITATFYAIDAIVNFNGGKAASHPKIGRKGVIIFAAICDLTAYITLLIWKVFLH